MMPVGFILRSEIGGQRCFFTDGAEAAAVWLEQKVLTDTRTAECGF